MKLPKIDLPIFEAILPSTGEKVRYRAFTVKEEKIMLIAKESSDVDQIIMSIKQVLNNCILDKNLNELAVFDIEFLLTMIRGKSVNNIIDFSVRDPDTQEEVKLSLDIEDINIVRDDKHTDVIRVNDDYVLYMKYPNFDSYIVTFSQKSTNDPMAYYDVMVQCMDKLVSEDTVYKLSEFSPEEVDQFIESLGTDVIGRIQQFFETMPKLRHEIKYKNKNGDDKTFVIEGTDSFFI